MRVININKGVTMKNISIALVIALIMGILLSSGLQANDSNKPDSLKSSITENIKAKPQSTTAAAPAPAKRGGGGWIPYRGEIGGDRVEDSYRFLELNKDSFGLINPRQELKLKEVIGPDKIIKGQTVKLYQVVNGVKVRYGQYFIHFSPDGTMNGINGQIDPEARQIDTNPAISEEQSKQLAIAHPRAKRASVEHITKTELIIGRFNKEMRLAWGVTIFKADSTGLVGDAFYIDAQNGRVLEVQNQIAF
jgi:hypothetical protein